MPERLLDGGDEHAETVCDFAGHEWAEAGGGLLICTVCRAEKWAEPAREEDGDAS